MKPLALFVLVAGCLGLSSCDRKGGGAGANQPVKIDRYQEVAEFQFTSQESQPVSRDDLSGKVWVANFVFTSCGAECLVLSQKMAALQDRFAENPEVAFASFSVDPQTDHPERLASYSQRWGANPERWFFLTGDPTELDGIIKGSFLLPVTRSPGDQAKLMTGGLVHSNKLAIVGRDGVVRAYVEGLESNALDEATRVITQLLAEPKAVPSVTSPGA